jgi:hypothetical protein
MDALRNIAAIVASKATPEEKRRAIAGLKALAHSRLAEDHGARFPMTWKDGDLTITVPSPPVLIADGFRLRNVMATWNGTPLKVDPDLGWHNPPLCVHDPAGTIVRTAVDRDGVTSERRLRFAPLEVFRRIVAATVRETAR